MIRIEQRSLDEIEPGICLAAAVSDSAGKVLLAEGVELTPSLITALQKRGLSHVPVAVETCCSAEELSVQRERIKNRVLWLFRDCGDDPLMNKLCEAVLEYQLENGQRVICHLRISSTSCRNYLRCLWCWQSFWKASKKRV